MNKSSLFHIGALLGAIYGSTIVVLMRDVNQTTLICLVILMAVFFSILCIINDKYGKEVKT